MKRQALVMIAVPALILAFLVPFNKAQAQVSVSGGVAVSGGVSVSGGVVIAPAPPPPPEVVITPPAPVVVQPAPFVIVTPSPPPVVIRELSPKPSTPPRIIITAPPLRPPFRPQFGIGLRISGALFGAEDDFYEDEGTGMGGAGILFRMRVLPHFAMELGVDAYGGNAYDGEERAEVPVALGLMWMPMYYLTRLQFYTIAGAGCSFARVGNEPYIDEPIYVGGFLGLGFELKLGFYRRVALFTDLRGLIRKRVNDRPDDPYIPDGGSCRDDGSHRTCTDWEGGVTMSFGLAVYF